MKLTHLAGIAGLALAGCTSAPTQYYTLLPTVQEAPAPRSAGPLPFQFELASVQVPVQVDQPQLVVRQQQGVLAILENQRWGSPLADEFHDALADQLERQLGVRDLAGLPKAPGVPIVSVQNDVRRFDSLPGRYALIDVVWSLGLRGDSQQRRQLTCSSQISRPAGVELDSLVKAHQQAIAELAQTIADTARRWQQNPASQCPPALTRG